MSLGLFIEDDTIGMVTWLDSMENGNGRKSEASGGNYCHLANGTVADIPGTMPTRKHCFQFLVSTKIRMNHSYNN